ncbi:plasmid partitioning protein RepB C-terminal domain-containing protein [Bradyrhizobium sp. G127]|uniref:plasmid partitioning protein RepB C-terminal domain-containing protein n=1 Tax=Bradyrhizobium sp. G127 TaxID=2904800 RepID=UPI001F328DA0|nr:plasmid partitioning protein RepB C-terminal domain-containing protein [Bradyrhizobium sp. G127]MCF2524907.1 ParB N-terminal domain-containing protein [Bradyrhizobium sp. G127]
MVESVLAKIQLIAISKISVINPRIRNKKSFRELVENIAALGLKKPITVTRREEREGKIYDLVCGQGRLEAFIELGEAEIPALVIEASVEDCMIKSLVENCARRHHQAIDLLHDIGGMRTRGYSDSEIAKKTGLSFEYVRGVGRLLAQGEQRLLRAVESGHIPVSVAVEIAEADDVGVQEALQQAYEKNLLRGRKLMIVKRLVENRRRRGRRFDAEPKKGGQKLSTRSLVRVYREDTDRKRLLIRKADATRNRLIFIAHAMRELFGDEKFISLLKAEKLDSMPKKLMSRMERGDVA